MTRRAPKILAVAATAAATIVPAALAAPAPTAPVEAAAPPAATNTAPETTVEAPATPPEAAAPEGEAAPKSPFQQGTTLAPEPSEGAAKAKAPKQSSGGTTAGSLPPASTPETPPPASAGTEGALPAPNPIEALAIPELPASTCAATGVPPVLIPMYQRAAAAYGLGPQGPAVLAGINEVETAFGTNLNISSAGAQGWMQ
ncbi:MAG: hypothetical protein ABW065_08420, partial [Solirubrobacterales bacterium]